MAVTNEQLEAVGIDVEPTLARFMNNTDFLLRMLGMFVSENAAANMEEALNSGDPDAIERAFHAVKGTSANLGLATLSSACSTVVEAKRSGQMENIQQQGEDAINLCRATYEKIAALTA